MTLSQDKRQVPTRLWLSDQEKTVQRYSDKDLGEKPVRFDRLVSWLLV